MQKIVSMERKFVYSIVYSESGYRVSSSVWQFYPEIALEILNLGGQFRVFAEIYSYIGGGPNGTKSSGKILPVLFSSVLIRLFDFLVVNLDFLWYGWIEVFWLKEHD